jgi:glycolate oxidase
MSGLIEAFISIVGGDGCLSRPEDLLVYECDGLTIHTAQPTAVVFPRSTDDVVRIVKACRHFRTPFVPRGAGTGLSGARSRTMAPSSSSARA